MRTDGEPDPLPDAPAITGTLEVGETLTADISAHHGRGRRSHRQPVRLPVGPRATAPTTATWTERADSTYTVVEADAGKTIKVRVSFTDNAKFPESLTGAATDCGDRGWRAGQQRRPNGMATGACEVTASQSQGQGFTTGSDSGGYTLGSVELAVSSFSRHRLRHNRKHLLGEFGRSGDGRAYPHHAGQHFHAGDHVHGSLRRRLWPPVRPTTS